ncbi:hypothetical protein LTR36_002754 [Oleoguttula mirabilis]|uniref:Uncharacterized protein n=1 Tax=Oleoguttula mirabilis TaxID=1507867 RepID=A0AAV9JIZ6_9PEZI|nr:hypothetical protein LTR36_002754 [Oleoguttula mirabilis]
MPRTKQTARKSAPSLPPDSTYAELYPGERYSEEEEDYDQQRTAKRRLRRTFRKHLQARKGAAAAHASAIRSAIRTAYAELAEDCCDAKHTGVTSDDISASMEPLVDEIEELSEFADPDSVRLAIDLLVELGDRSYGELDAPHGAGYGERPSDPASDDLFCHLVTIRRERDPAWD